MEAGERVNIYYAGLDNYSLPLGDGEKLISVSSSKQVDYIKLLCLVADEVIVPPSFYFYWVGTAKKPKQMSLLMDLYQAGFVSSAVHSTMSESKDFLAHKLIYGTKEDKSYISANKQVLDELFSEIPLTKRNVAVQSGGFREKVEGEILRAYRDSRYRESLLTKLGTETPRGGVIASREEVNILHYIAHDQGLISKHELRKYYYTTNKCYYHQGAITYNSIISILDAHRYTILGKHLFETKHGILLGYDPQVIEGILNSFGITDRVISSLSTQEILKIRSSEVFGEFKSAYNEFSRELQRVSVLVNGLSKEKLIQAQIIFREEFLSRYFSQKHEYEKSMGHWAFGEMTVFALALGAVGFFVIPVVGAILGFLPILLWKSGLTPKLGGFVVNQITDAKTAFYKFVTELRVLANEMEKNELLQ